MYLLQQIHHCPNRVSPGLEEASQERKHRRRDTMAGQGRDTSQTNRT